MFSRGQLSTSLTGSQHSSIHSRLTDVTSSTSLQHQQQQIIISPSVTNSPTSFNSNSNNHNNAFVHAHRQFLFRRPPFQNNTQSPKINSTGGALLVGQQEGHRARKKIWEDGGGGHWLVRMEWRPAGWSVCLPLLISPCTIKSRSSLLAPSHPGGPGKRAVKRLWCGGVGGAHNFTGRMFFPSSSQQRQCTHRNSFDCWLCPVSGRTTGLP